MISHSVLAGTDYLPSLEGKVWDDEKKPSRAFPDSLRLHFKRQKVDLKIIKKESDKSAKYDLFERLNTLGSQLSDQEVRNCLLVMINPSFYRWLEELSQQQAFQETTALTDRALQERYDMELALRFFILATASVEDLKGIKDVADYITRRMRAIADDRGFQQVRSQQAFSSTFELLAKALGGECFRRHEEGKGRGGFLISVFEVVAIGMGFHFMNNPSAKFSVDQVKKAYDKIWDNADFRKYSKSGVSASSRIPRLIPLGRKVFNFT